MRTFVSLLLVALILAAVRHGAAQPCPDLQEVLDAHGAAALPEVLSLDFAFHAQTDRGEIVRTWHWDLRTNQVTLSTPGEDDSMLLLAFQSPPPPEASEQIRTADRQFLNDRFWLLFPHRLAWDDWVTVTVECEPQPAPISGERFPRITAVYGQEGGYTPGDAYDFWVRPDGRIAEWAFRRTNAAEATVIVAFGEYGSLGPLLVSETRHAVDGTPRVWFTDLAAVTSDQTFTFVAAD